MKANYIIFFLLLTGFIFVMSCDLSNHPDGMQLIVQDDFPATKGTPSPYNVYSLVPIQWFVGNIWINFSGFSSSNPVHNKFKTAFMQAQNNYNSVSNCSVHFDVYKQSSATHVITVYAQGSGATQGQFPFTKYPSVVVPGEWVTVNMNTPGYSTMSQQEATQRAIHELGHNLAMTHVSDYYTWSIMNFSRWTTTLSAHDMEILQYLY
ncbi:MAG: hypothetical protein JXB88_03565 [Spirochaetales bacterium]|nr:hypothetical protein [Spirochaetales bacterium]